MMTMDMKRFERARRHLKCWRTLDEIMRHTQVSRRTAYRWLAKFPDLVKRGSRDQTEYRLTNWRTS
jgi:predicted DNA-binding transcriptional regulator AlpA